MNAVTMQLVVNRPINSSCVPPPSWFGFVILFIRNYVIFMMQRTQPPKYGRAGGREGATLIPS